MKYLLVTTEYSPYRGGVAHYYGNLVKHWHEHIEVLTNAGSKLIDERLPMFKWLPSLYWIAREIKAQKIDYVMVGQILPVGTAVWLLSWVMNFKYCVFLHGLDLSMTYKTSSKKWLARQILNRADKIICANSRTAAEARGLVLPLKINKVTVVNPGIDTKPRVYDEVVIRDLKQRYDLRGKAVLLTVGRLVRRKGVDLVLEALAACTDKSLVYVIIGSGPEEASIKELISELGLQDQVRLLLDVDDEEKAHWFQVADIFVMTSRDEAGDYEGFGIVYLEAGLAGKPVIAARGGGVADAVIDKETGLLVKPGDINELKAAIIKLRNYEGLRIRLGDNGRRRAQSEFNWEGQAGKIFDIIAEQ